MSAYIQYYFCDKDSGQEWDCQPKNFDGQCQNLRGIGFSKKSTFGEVNDFFKETYTQKKQDKITGEMVFLSEQKYNRFADFIQSDNLCIKRKTADGKTLFVDVALIDFQRNDVNPHLTSMCLCDIDFVALSPWYKKTYLIDNARSNNTQSSDDLSAVFSFNIESKAGAMTVIKIMGPVTNPRWTLLASPNVIEGSYDGTIEDGEFLLIDSNYIDPSVFLHKGNISLNAWNNCDRTKKNLIFLPKGQSVLEIYSDAKGHDITTYVEVKEIVRIP